MRRELTFRIGDAFPANDPVARFVAVLAIIYNDWRLTMDSMAASIKQPNGMGIRLLRFASSSAIRTRQPSS